MWGLQYRFQGTDLQCGSSVQNPRDWIYNVGVFSESESERYNVRERENSLIDYPFSSRQSRLNRGHKEAVAGESLVSRGP
jgi:hypothetical protein